MISSVKNNGNGRQTRAARAQRGGLADDQIAKAATNAIDWVTTVPAEYIKISVRRGCIHLGGSVISWHEKQVVEEAVRQLEGVSQVINAIVISPSRNAQ